MDKYLPSRDLGGIGLSLLIVGYITYTHRARTVGHNEVFYERGGERAGEKWREGGREGELDGERGEESKGELKIV